MNDDALEEEKQELLKYQEKVINSSLLFAPNEEECVAIALDEEFPGRSHLREFCISLGISNIRVIKKIERLVIHVHPLLKDLDDKVFRQAVQTLTLFGWAYYSRIEGDGSTFLDFAVKKFLWGSTDQSKMTDTEGQWNRILDVYGFKNADDLDLILLDGIKVGFFDEDRLVREAKKLHDLHVAQQAEVSLEQAFRPLHDFSSIIKMRSSIALSKGSKRTSSSFHPAPSVRSSLSSRSLERMTSPRKLWTSMSSKGAQPWPTTRSMTQLLPTTSATPT